MLKLSSCSSPRRAGSKLSSWLPTDDIYDEIYDEIYDDIYDDIYGDIYDDIYDDIYNDIYDNSDLMLIARPAMTILCL